MPVPAFGYRVRRSVPLDVGARAPGAGAGTRPCSAVFYLATSIGRHAQGPDLRLASGAKPRGGGAAVARHVGAVRETSGFLHFEPTRRSSRKAPGMAAAALAAARADMAGAAASRDSRRGTVVAAGAPTRAADSGRRCARMRRRLATLPGCRSDNPPGVGAIKFGYV